jgi:hypothetical protein
METTMTKNIRRAHPNKAVDPLKVQPSANRRVRHSKTKKQVAMALLERRKGASITELQKAMGWQAHSVRGFLSGTIKRTPDVTLLSEKVNDGPRRYRIEPMGG